MKNTIFISLSILFTICFSTIKESKADIIIKGKASYVVVNGQFKVSCDGNKNKCITIYSANNNNLSKVSIYNYDNETQIECYVSDYTIEQIDDITTVILLSNPQEANTN